MHRLSTLKMYLAAALLALALGCAPGGGGRPGFFHRIFSKPAPPPTLPPDRVQNAYRFDRNGWIYVHIEGEPHERGYQHGWLVAPELKEVQRTLRHIIYCDTAMDWDFFIKQAERLYASKLDDEMLTEIKGIADGARAAGTDISWQEVLAWNVYMEMMGYWWPKQDKGKFYPENKEHCSAFLAAGTTCTLGGRVVMAHNSWCDFIDGQFYNEIQDIQPARGHRIFMQSGPGLIHSATDFALTNAGLALTETTIGGFNGYDENGAPEFYRIRKAMQYADTLDDFTRIMKEKNNGGYANSWLVADVKSGEIMRLELGLKHQAVEKTKGGYYLGFNGPTDPRIRHFESGSINLADIRGAIGARKVRLTQLMRQYRGRLDIKAAEAILADHYDVYLEREQPGSRTVDGHHELDKGETGGGIPYNPSGAIDGKVLDTELAKKMSFWARWGNSCGTPFDTRAFLEKHIQFDYLDGYLKDRPTQPWTLFQAGERPGDGVVKTVAPVADTPAAK